jgi:hypothetical protein
MCVLAVGPVNGAIVVVKGLSTSLLSPVKPVLVAMEGLPRNFI